MPSNAKRKPGKSDVSRPRRSGDYAYKKEFYRDGAVAADYDFHRFGNKRRMRRNAKKWKAIRTALALTDGVRSVLDLPCGTGRFTGHLARQGYLVVGGDISLEMMQVGRRQLGDVDGIAGHVQADAEALPLRSGAVDCVMTIRFLHHVDPPTRVRILSEMGRVSRRWVIADYRHRYTHRYFLRQLKRMIGLGGGQLARVSREQLEREFREAGLSVRSIVPVTRFFSDKWVVVGERTAVAT